MESIAFGTRKVIDTFHHNGVEINELYACGGLPLKNKLLMQIYADVTNRVIKIADSNHTPAIGARSEEHTSELQSRFDLVCRLLLEKKNEQTNIFHEQKTTF